MLSLAAPGLTCDQPLFNLYQTRPHCSACHGAFANLTPHQDLDRIITSHHTSSSINNDTRLRIQWQQTATFTKLEAGT
jgi:hypothetical protein